MEADPVSSDIGTSSWGRGDKDPGLLGEDSDSQEDRGIFDWVNTPSNEMIIEYLHANYTI